MRKRNAREARKLKDEIKRLELANGPSPDPNTSGYFVWAYRAARIEDMKRRRAALTASSGDA